jgi:RecG-like helicase
MDLLLRGPGDLLRKKQYGHHSEFPIARLVVHVFVVVSTLMWPLVSSLNAR